MKDKKIIVTAYICNIMKIFELKYVKVFLYYNNLNCSNLKLF